MGVPSEQLKRDKDLVFKYMNPKGEEYGKLDAIQKEHVFIRADGLGVVTYSYLKARKFPWKHVRDSSPPAMTSMARAIRTLLQFRGERARE